MSECPNPSKPCHLHDERNEWRIEFVGTTIHSGWFVAGLIIVGILTLIPGWA